MLKLKKDDVPNHELSMATLNNSMRKGIRITDNINELQKEYNEKLRARTIYIEHRTNISKLLSVEQLKTYFLPYLTPTQIEKCKVNGKFTFGKTVLNYLVEQEIPMAKEILEARTIKNKADVLNSLKEYMDSKGLVYPEVSRGKTFRYSYAKPAIMSIPKDLLWQVIKPRNPNNVLYAVDIHQQEPYILVHYLKIDALIQLLKDEPDFYKAIYKQAFKEDCPSKEHRKEVKKVWNALSYGGTKNIKNLCTLINPQPIVDFFKGIKEYRNYTSKSFYYAHKNATYRKTYFNTKVYTTGNEVYKLARSNMDIPIQGTGSDILSFLIEHLLEVTKEKQLQDKLEFYFSRHDELILEVSPELENVEELLTDIFTHQVDDWIPFSVKVTKITDNNLSELAEDDE